jgi:benzoylformate decarboxylase
MSEQLNPQSGGQLFFEAAQKYGVTHVFGNPGTTEVNFMDALSQTDGMQFFLCLQEDIATGAADGYARISGNPAIVNVHLAPGLTNAMANIHNAKRARVPMIVTVGDHHTAFGLEESALAGDIVGIAGRMCKWAWSVSSAEEIPSALHRAMRMAMTPPLGPVCLALPNNVLSQKVNAAINIPDLHIAKPGPAHPAAIEEAIGLLKKAERPLIVVGEVYSRQAREAVLRVGQVLRASVIREPFPTRVDPSTDPIPVTSEARLPYMPQARREILKASDCILLLGVSNFTSLFLYDSDPEPALVPPHIPVIHADADANELGKNAKHALPLLGDVDLTVLELQKALNIEPAIIEVTENTAIPDFKPDDDQPLTSAVLGQALKVAVPPGTIFMDESITSGQGIWNNFVNNNRNLTHVTTGRGGALGYGLPSSIGAQIASPGKPVLAISGDGTAAYVIQYLWTLARYKLPVVSIICSNRNYDIITLEILRAKGKLADNGVPKILEYTALANPSVNFAALAEGFGVTGYRVTKPSELVPAIEKAFASGAPTLLDVSIVSPFK